MGDCLELSFHKRNPREDVSTGEFQHKAVIPPVLAAGKGLASLPSNVNFSGLSSLKFNQRISRDKKQVGLLSLGMGYEKNCFKLP